MLDDFKLKKIGINACISILDDNLLKKYKDEICFSYTEEENNMFCQISFETRKDKLNQYKEKLILTHEKPEHIISCYVNRYTGEVTNLEHIINED